MQLFCNDPCTDGDAGIYQNINSLTTGHKYTVSFYAAAWSYLRWDDLEEYMIGLGSRPPGPLIVKLGGQLVPSYPSGAQSMQGGQDATTDLPYPISATPEPIPGDMLDILNWKKISVDFIYSGLTGTTPLSFVFQYVHDRFDQVGCLPCSKQGIYMALPSMYDTTTVVPSLKVQKTLGSARVADTDQFTVQITQNSSTVVNATTNSTTTGTGATVTAGTGTTGATSLVTGTSYTITEAASGTTKLPQYNSTLACTDASGASKALSLNTPFTLADNDAITCTLTNTPKAPTVRLSKALGTAGRINNADQFTVLVGQRLTTLASATTTGTGGVVNTGSTAWTSLVAGTSYSLSEVMTGTSVSSLGQYSAVLSCSNAWTGSPTVVPSAAPVAFTPTYGDVLDCTWTNKPAFASLTITQRAIVTAPATFNPPETFVYTGNNGWTSQSNSSSKVNTATTGATQNLASLNVATTLTVAVPTVERGWRIASIQCTDTNAAVSKNPSPPTVLASSTSNMVTIPANYVVNNAKLQCAVFASRQI